MEDRQDLADMFHDVARALPAGWPEAEDTFTRIVFDGQVYVAGPFVPVGSRLSRDIMVDGEARGKLEVYCPRRCEACMLGLPVNQHGALIDIAAHMLGQAAENCICGQTGHAAPTEEQD